MSFAKTFVKLHKHEIAICRFTNQWCRYPSVRGFFGTISRLGDGAIWVALIAVFAIWVNNGLERALHLSVLALASICLYATLKRWSKRERPLHRDPELIISTQPLDHFSFPSGHTLHAVALSYVAISYVPALAIVLVPFSLLVALSRVVLGLHYPTDVAAAAVIGISFAESSLQIALASGIQ
jgi:undecaprenyl-diphosphatase